MSKTCPVSHRSAACSTLGLALVKLVVLTCLIFVPFSGGRGLLDELVVQTDPAVDVEDEELGAERIDITTRGGDHLPLELDRAVVADGLLACSEQESA